MNSSYDRNIEIAQQAALVTHSPGDATRYTFFIAAMDDGKRKTFRVFPCDNGATVRKDLSIGEDDPDLGLIDIAPGSAQRNVKALSLKYPGFRDRFGENVWTYAEVLLLVKRLSLSGDFHKIVE